MDDSPQDRLITLSAVLERGWKRKAIRDLLDPPDKLTTNRYYKRGPAVRLYLLDRVVLLEQSQVFQATGKKSSVRSEATKKAAEKRRQALFEHVRQLSIPIPKLPRGELVTLACAAYNDLWEDRGRFEKRASPRDDPAFLNRIAVNYLRHECSHYEDELDDLFGKVGASPAYVLLRRRIMVAIKEAYPELAKAIRADENRAKQ